MAPLVPLALALAFGIWLAGVLPLTWAAIAAGASLLACAQPQIRRWALPCALWLVLGIARVTVWQTHPDMMLAQRLPEQPVPVALHVRIEQELEHASDPNAPTYVIRTLHERLPRGWVPRPGRLRMVIRGTPRAIAVGEEALVEGNWSRIPPPTNPGEPDRRARWARDRIFGVVRVRSQDPLVVWPARAARVHLDANAWIAPLRRRWQRMITSAMPTRSAGLVRSMVLGQRVALDGSVRAAFIETGTMHLLIVSGSNVALIAWMALGLLCVTGLPWRTRLWACAILLGGYALLTGADPPIVRATLMAWAFLWAIYADRTLNWPNALALAGLIMLLTHPPALQDPSAQLSFGAVASLALFAPRCCRMLEARLTRMPRWARRAIATGIGATLAVSVGLLPLLAWYFHQVTPVGVLANVLVAPCVALITIVGTAGLILGTFVHALWRAIAPPLWLLTEFTYLVVQWCHAIPWGSIAVPRPPLVAVAGYYAALALTAWLIRRGIPTRRLLAGWITVLLVTGIGVWAHARSQAPVLALDMLDVGHGDALMLRTPGGRVWLIDAGNEVMGQTRVLPVLRAAGIRRLDTLVLTHSDADHLAGAIPLLQELQVGRILTNGGWDDTMSARMVQRLIAQQRIPLRMLTAGEQWAIEPGLQVRVLHPPAAWRASTARSENDRCLVLQITYGRARFLLTGDVEEQGIPMMVGQPGLGAWVLQMPHHGSRLGDAGEALVRIAHPAMAMISAGELYGLPSHATLALLDAHHIPVFTTRVDGAIRLVTDGAELTLTTMRTNRRLTCRSEPAAVDAALTCVVPAGNK